MRRRRRPVLSGILGVSLLLAGCGGVAGGDEDNLRIVTTTSIWGDVVSQMVGDDASVEVIFPLGADSHEYEPTTQQIAAIQEADLVIANGLGLEEGLGDILDAAVEDGTRVYEVGEDLDPIPFAGGEHEDHEGEGTGHGDEGEETSDHDGDPHVWFDPLRMATAVGLIAERLAEIDSSIDWVGRAAEYATDLESADAEIIDILAAVPEPNRKLVTNHESFGYFAERYGFEVIGVVIPGGSTLADPSSAELAALVEEIHHVGVTTIFAETSQPSALAESVAAEVGDEVAVVELFTESLGEPGSGAETLIDMLLIDARRIADALSP